MRTEERQAMHAVDERHWWYRGRRRIVRTELDRLGLPPGARLLDAGCGSGRTLDDLREYGRVDGVDLAPEAVARARARGHAVALGRLEQLPYPDGSFDAVTCLDVLEHTADDRLVLRELRRVVRPGGYLLVTVPAYPSLWSAHDEANDHRRRYRRRTLRAAAGAAGWSVVRDTHFNAALLPPAALVRLARRGQRRNGLGAPTRSDLALTPAALDGALELPLRLEAGLLRAGARLPAGLSILAVLRSSAVPARRERAPGASRPRLTAAAGGLTAARAILRLWRPTASH